MDSSHWFRDSVSKKIKPKMIMISYAYWIPYILFVNGGSQLCTGGSDQDHPQVKEMQKGKMVAWGGLTNSWEKKRSKSQRRKGKIYPFECRVPKNSKER